MPRNATKPEVSSPASADGGAASMAEPMLPAPYRIQRQRREAHDTFTLDLAAADGGRPPRFAPGQFNMLYLFGVGEVAISISGNPGTPETLQHTTRAVGSVTKAMEKLRAGDVIGVRGPFGTHWPTDHARGKDVVFVAGGIGLAPLRPAMYEILRNRAHYNKAVLLYGTRTPSDILFKRELKQWGGNFDVDVYVTVDRATGTWRGNVGVVTQLIRRSPFDPGNCVAMICGPEVMMKYAVDEFRRRGVDSQDIFLSMERNMKCAIGFCGHCQWGPNFVCKDGPVFRHTDIEHLLNVWEI